MAALVAATAAAHWWGLRKPWPGTHVQIARQGQAHGRGHSAVPRRRVPTPGRRHGTGRLLRARRRGQPGPAVAGERAEPGRGGHRHGRGRRRAGHRSPLLRAPQHRSPVLRLERGSPSGSWPCPRSRSPRSIHRGSWWRSSPSPAAWREACSPLSKPLRSPIAGDRRPTVRATACSAARRWAPQHLLHGRGRSWQTMSAASPQRSGCWPWAWWSRPQASDPQQAGAFLRPDQDVAPPPWESRLTWQSVHSEAVAIARIGGGRPSPTGAPVGLRTLLREAMQPGANAQVTRSMAASARDPTRSRNEQVVGSIPTAAQARSPRPEALNLSWGFCAPLPDRVSPLG